MDIYFQSKLKKLTKRSRSFWIRIPTKYSEGLKGVKSVITGIIIPGNFKKWIKYLKQYPQPSDFILAYWYKRVKELPIEFYPMIELLGEFTGWELITMLWNLEFGDKHTAAILAETIRRRYFAYFQTYDFYGSDAIDYALVTVREQALGKETMPFIFYDHYYLYNSDLISRGTLEDNIVKLPPATFNIALRDFLFTVALATTHFKKGRKEIEEPANKMFTQLILLYYSLAIDEEKRIKYFNIDPLEEKRLTSSVPLLPPEKRTG